MLEKMGGLGGGQRFQGANAVWGWGMRTSVYSIFCVSLKRNPWVNNSDLLYYCTLELSN